jgi:uncharacterized membrane protein
MCEVCSQRGQLLLCPACRARSGTLDFPLRRDTWNFSALWDYCFETFKRDWVMLSVAALVSSAVGMMANLSGNVVSSAMQGQGADSLALTGVLLLFTILLQVVVQGTMALGMLRVVFDVLEGGGVDVARVFSQFPKVGRYLVTVLLTSVLLLLPLVLLFLVLSFIGLAAAGLSVSELAGGQALESMGPTLAGVFVVAGLVTLIPAIYFGLPLYLLQAELTFNEDVSPMQALRNCYALARGERSSIFGVSFVAGLLVFAGVLACCVGAIPAIAMGQLLVGGLYLALRNGSELE